MGGGWIFPKRHSCIVFNVLYAQYLFKISETFVHLFWASTLAAGEGGCVFSTTSARFFSQIGGVPTGDDERLQMLALSSAS